MCPSAPPLRPSSLQPAPSAGASNGTLRKASPKDEPKVRLQEQYIKTPSQLYFIGVEDECIPENQLPEWNKPFFLTHFLGCNLWFLGVSHANWCRTHRQWHLLLQLALLQVMLQNSLRVRAGHVAAKAGVLWHSTCLLDDWQFDAPKN